MEQGALDFGITEESFEPDAVAAVPGKALNRYELFLALFPEREQDERALAALSLHIRDRHRLVGVHVPDERLHTTLVKVAAFSPGAIPRSRVNAARVAASRVYLPSMRLSFDRVYSAAFGEGHGLFLGYDARSIAAIATLRVLLAKALRDVGHAPRHSTPSHMTLMYQAPGLGEMPLEPVHWTATHFRLVLSHVGLAHHQVIGRWPLGQQV